MGCFKSKEQRETDKIMKQMQKAMGGVSFREYRPWCACCKSKERVEKEKALAAVKNAHKMFASTPQQREAIENMRI